MLRSIREAFNKNLIDYFREIILSFEELNTVSANFLGFMERKLLETRVGRLSTSKNGPDRLQPIVAEAKVFVVQHGGKA